MLERLPVLYSHDIVVEDGSPRPSPLKRSGYMRGCRFDTKNNYTRLTRGARPALADLQRAPLRVATKSDATVNRVKVSTPSLEFRITCHVLD